MVNGIVRSLGGGLSLAHSVDEAMTLEIWLPAASLAAATPVTESAPKPEAARATTSGI